MSNLFERISKIAELKGFNSINDFARNGLGYASSEKINRLKDPSKKPGFDILEDISNKFEDINIRWLVTGEGSINYMLPDNDDYGVGKSQTIYPLRTDKIIEEVQAIPLYDISSSLGFVALFQDIGSATPIDHLYIPNAPKCDGAITATGDSMYPLIKSGDFIAFKKVIDKRNDIFWGEKYILSLNISGDEMLTTKFVKKSSLGPEYIKLVGQNKHHEDKDIHLSNVVDMALVKIVVRIEIPK